MIKDLLLDILDILFPILLYQYIVLTKPILKRRSPTHQVVLGLLCGVAIILSMLLPSTITNDFNGDLRNIPFIISLLYGGFMGGAISLACFSLCRLFIHVDGFVVAFISAWIVMSLTSFFVPRFMKRTPRNRFFVVNCLLLFGFAVSICSSFLQNQTYDIVEMSVILQIALLQLVTMCMSSFLMEVTIKTNTMQEQILHSEKLSIAGHLASSVAHELRSPLTVIKGFIQLSLKNAEGRTKDYLEATIAEMNRAEYIINDFLNYAKPQLEKIEIVSVADVFSQMMDMIDPLSQIHNVQLEISSEDHLWVRVDKLKLIQALTNIVKNSFEASKSQQGVVSIHAYRADPSDVCIKICDRGCGMTDDELNKLGTPFYSTQNNGTGLGLMVAFKIIKVFGGTIKYSSEKGKGTEVCVLLPMIAKD